MKRKPNYADDFDDSRFDRDDTGQDEPIDTRSYAEVERSDRSDYASEMVRKGQWCPIQAAEYRMGA